VRQIEQQQLGITGIAQCQLGLIAKFQRIATGEADTIDVELAAYQVQISAATGRKCMAQFLAMLQHRCVQSRILMNAHGSFGAIRRGDQAQPAAL